MLGAIIGDVVGSAYEFAPTDNYDFEMFRPDSAFTDDTICTIAIADAMLKGRDYGASLHDWCRRHTGPKGGFGGSFRLWVESDNPLPYNSFGNGSAMRVSPVGMWFCCDARKVDSEAKRSAECTHSHPEGIRGAQAVAQAVCRAVGTFGGRHVGPVGADFASALLADYGYDPTTDYENFRGIFDETCQRTVPPALDIIRKSTGFEDAVRRAVSLGADADTIGAIVGSIAEHIWGIPAGIRLKALTYLTDEMRTVVGDFYRAVERRNCLRPECAEHGRTTPPVIDRLNEGEIFVFGSNARGHHGGGAARTAMERFGAVWGVGDGLRGQSYAISTMEGLAATAANVSRFIDFAAMHRELTFLVTPIGCGIAGYTPQQIAPLFGRALPLPNVYLPQPFWHHLRQSAPGATPR